MKSKMFLEIIVVVSLFVLVVCLSGCPALEPLGFPPTTDRSSEAYQDWEERESERREHAIEEANLKVKHEIEIDMMKEEGWEVWAYEDFSEIGRIIVERKRGISVYKVGVSDPSWMPVPENAPGCETWYFRVRNKSPFYNCVKVALDIVGCERHTYPSGYWVKMLPWETLDWGYLEQYGVIGEAFDASIKIIGISVKKLEGYKDYLETEEGYSEEEIIESPSASTSEKTPKLPERFPEVRSTKTLKWYKELWYKSPKEVQKTIDKSSNIIYPKPSKLRFKEALPKRNVEIYSLDRKVTFHFLYNRLAKISCNVNFKNEKGITSYSFLQSLLEEYRNCPHDMRTNEYNLKTHIWYFKNDLQFIFKQKYSDTARWTITTKEWRNQDWTTQAAIPKIEITESPSASTSGFTSGFTWDESFWGKSKEEVLKEINETHPLGEMKLFNKATILVKGFENVILETYTVVKSKQKGQQEITFFDNRMVRESFWKRYSDRLPETLDYYYKQRYEHISKEFDGCPAVLSKDKNGLVRYTWHLDNGIQFELRYDSTDRIITCDVTSEEWRAYILAYKEHQKKRENMKKNIKWR